MKITKEYGQWVAHTKGFNPTSGPSTLPFEEEEETEDAPKSPAPASDILDSSVPHPSRGRSTFMRCNTIFFMIASTLSPHRL